MDVIVKTSEGDKVGNTQGVKTPEPEQVNMRRVTFVDLDGPLGEFIGPALCFISPGGFRANNWKSKLTTFISSKTAHFVCCGRAVGLAFIEQNTMSGENEVHGMFMLVDEGGLEDDAVAILRAQKQWARDMGIGYRPPHKEYSSLSQSKMQVALKAEKREELFVPALKK